MPKLLDLTGQKFHMLTALAYTRDGRRTYWECRCDCGKMCRVETHNLRRADRKPSCGCYGKLVISLNNSTHRLSGTRIYRVWSSMKRRCQNPNDTGFANYGGRGIKVCERWACFETFLEDIGMPPTNSHTLDRIDVNGDYEPENCRWATKKTQARNTRRNVRYEYDGRKLVAAEIAELTGISVYTLQRRLRTGVSIELATSMQDLRYKKTSRLLTD